MVGEERSVCLRDAPLYELSDSGAPKRGIMVGEDLLSSTVNAAVHHIESDLS